jgi:hypothetical protein
MDYGGHDSLFRSNAVVGLSTTQDHLVGTAGFFQWPASRALQIFDNDCVVQEHEVVDWLFDTCREGQQDPPVVGMIGFNNRFYTPLANASATCDCCGTVSLAQLQAINPTLEANATSSGLPSADTIVAWARDKLQLPAATQQETLRQRSRSSR